MTWAELERVASDVAAPAREVLERWGFGVLGTIRRDGTPRLSVVEVHFVGGRLAVVTIRGTHKTRDVLRDPRVALNAPVASAAAPGAEVKLRGRLVEVHDEAGRGEVADAVEARSGWRPREDWQVFELDVDDAAHIAWKGSEMTMTRWSRAGGVEVVARDVAG